MQLEKAAKMDICRVAKREEYVPVITLQSPFRRLALTLAVWHHTQAFIVVKVRL